MKRELPKYVYRKKGGRLYFQRGKDRAIPMRATDLAPDFFAEYTTLLNGVPQVPRKRNLARLMDSYERSNRFTRLAARTKADYRKQLDRLGKVMGDLDPADLLRRDVIRLRDANARNYRKANYLVQVLKVVLEHGIDEGWLRENVAKGVQLLTSPHAPREPWPQAMIDAYRATATGRELLLFELCLGTGQRIGDVLAMKWGDVIDGGIQVTQNKTGKRLWVPLTDRLRDALSATEKRSVFILTNHAATGPWSYRGASQAVRAVRQQIGALDHDIHSLRYSAASELALAGCTDELISSVTGQSPAMVARYTATVRQKVRAIKAQGHRNGTKTKRDF